MSLPHPEVLEQRTRRRIFETVGSQPGASARDIQRALGLGWGETAYHLDRLTRNGLLRRERLGRRDAYFQVQVDWEDRKVLLALRSPTAARLLGTLGSQGDLSFAELEQRLRVTKSTVSYHLSHLIRSGLVVPVKSPQGRRFHLSDPSRVLSLLGRYRAGARGRWLDQILETWGTLLSE